MRNENYKEDYTRDLAVRFYNRTRIAGDCLEYLGGHTVRLANGDFATPRRAAYLVEYGEIPIKEIRLICNNERCVEVAHFRLGRETKAGKRSAISRKRRNAILHAAQDMFETGKSLARKFGVSVGTISNILNDKKSRKSGREFKRKRKKGFCTYCGRGGKSEYKLPKRNSEMYSEI